MTMTTRTVRRSVAGLALSVAGLLVAAAAAPASAQTQRAAEAPAARVAEADSKPGELTYLRAKSTPATGYVAARDNVGDGGRVSTVKSTFVVSYHGFPANAKASFQRAVDLWSVLVKSPVPIRIDATWKSLPSGVLGGAGATDYLRNFPGAPQTNTWYPIGLANARAGQDLDTAKTDIVAEFSSVRSDWYLGTDGQVPAGKLDLTSVVLHEIGHGLGMTGGAYYQGGLGYWGAGTPVPDIYDRLAQSAGGTPLANYTSGSTALGSVYRSNAVRWGGAQGTAANGGTKPYLYSPNPWEDGSSIYHLDEAKYATGTPNALMTPYLDDGEALHDPGDIVLGMMRDVGWTTVGAKGVPAAPTFKTAIGGPAKVLIGWSPSIDTGRQFLTGFRIYRYDDDGASAAATYDVAANLTSFTVGGLANGTSYRFTVAAKNASGFGAQSAKSAPVKPVVMTPFTRADALVRQQFLDFHGREPSSAESQKWLTDLHSGARSPVQTVTGIARLTGSYDVSTRMTRLYSAYFERLPDYSGYGYWTGKLRAGSSLKKVSDTFAASSEFKNKYGPLSNTDFVKKVYSNVLHRSPDTSGLNYWVNKLNKKTASRGQVMLNFSESNENVTKMDSEVSSVLLRASMLRKMPTAQEYLDDTADLDGAGTLESLALEIMNSGPYDARVP
ncbi:MAG: hypothetical protein JWO77_2309 [Ilumatobacteraceae bacterium]|nr:hypothetical protein [Ilumatobacteraceae bacterium]